jgi:hypothetical protein
MAEELLPQEPDENNLNDDTQELKEHTPHRRRRRVRKRIRIKKKPGIKKKAKKIGERILWIAIIIAFLFTLIILVKQLNIVDEKNQKKKSFINQSPNYQIAISTIQQFNNSTIQQFNNLVQNGQDKRKICKESPSSCCRN